MKITQDTPLIEVMEINPFAGEILMSYGMPCISCPASLMETVGEAALVHRMDMECLLEDLNAEFPIYDETDEFSGYITDSELFERFN